MGIIMIVLFYIVMTLVSIDTLYSIYIKHKQYKIYKEKEVVINEKLKEFNATHKNSSNNLISYHSVAGGIAQSRTDKKEK